jgi:WD40 repeat protein
MRWNWTTKQLSAERFFPGSKDVYKVVAASDDGRRIAVGDDGFVMVWDGTLARQIGRIPIPRFPLMALSADGTRLATVSADQTSVLVWDTATSRLLLTLTDDDVRKFIAFTPSGQLIVANSSGGLTIWETQRPRSAVPQDPRQ